MRDYITKSNKGGIADSIVATKLGAGEANSFLTELKNAVSSSGQTLANAAGVGETTDQLAKTIAVYCSGGNHCVDTGAADNYVVNPPAPKKAVPTLFNGLTLSFTPANTNTGASTINYNSFGAIPVKKTSGGDLVGGELPANTNVIVIYNSTGGYFEIIAPVINPVVSTDEYPILLTSDVIYNIGTGGDFETIALAFDHLSRYHPTYSASGVRVTLNLLTGFVMAEQVFCDAINYGWVEIVGADVETVINSSAFAAITTGVYPAFAAINGGVLPNIKQMFRFATGAAATVYGIYLDGSGSTVIVDPACGVSDSGGVNLYLGNGASCNVDGAIFSGAGGNGIEAVNGCVVTAPACTVSDCGGSGVYAALNSTVICSGSTVSGNTTTDLSVTYYSVIMASNATYDNTSKTVDVITADGIILSGNPFVIGTGGESAPLFIENNIVFNIGTGGDFDTINAALEYLSRLIPVYKNCDSVRVTLNLLAGFTMAEQVFCDAKDFSWVEIVGADAQTTINQSTFTFTIDGKMPAFIAINAGILPVIDHLFQFNASPKLNIVGVYLSGSGSTVNMGPNTSGIKLAGDTAIFCKNGASASCEYCDFSGSGVTALRAESGSHIAAQGSTISDSDGIAVLAEGGSVIDVNTSTITGVASDGVYAINGSNIIAPHCNITGTGGIGVRAEQGSFIDVFETTVSGFLVGLKATTTSSIESYGCNITGCSETGVLSVSNSKININAGVVTGSAVDLTVSGGSIITAIDTIYESASDLVNTLLPAGIIFSANNDPK